MTVSIMEKIIADHWPVLLAFFGAVITVVVALRHKIPAMEAAQSEHKIKIEDLEKKTPTFVLKKDCVVLQGSCREGICKKVDEVKKSVADNAACATEQFNVLRSDVNKLENTTIAIGKDVEHIIGEIGEIKHNGIARTDDIARAVVARLMLRGTLNKEDT